MFCREQVARYDDHFDEFAELGVSLVAIGNGTIAMADKFSLEYDLGFPLFTDPTRASYQALGFTRGLRVRASMLKSSWRALAAGHRNGKVQGDKNQNGGALVISSSAEVLLFHSDDSRHDYLDVDAALSVLRDRVETKRAA